MTVLTRSLKDEVFNAFNLLPKLPFFLLKRREFGLRQAMFVYRRIMRNAGTVRLLKKTDTLAIMGSGPSINELSDADLEFLRTVDVFGFNFWAYHDLTPDFYMYEGAASPSRHQEFVRLMWQRRQQYAHVVFLFKYVPWFLRRRSLAEDFVDFPISVQSRIRLLPIERVRYPDQHSFQPGLYTDRAPTGIHPQTRGSLATILSMAFAMDYTQVILYGVDLSTGYFWRDEESPRGQLHETAQERKGDLAMLDFVPLLREKLYLPNGRDMFVASKTSRLFPRIPLWDSQREVRAAFAKFS